MKNRILRILSLILTILLVSCSSGADPAPESKPETVRETVDESVTEAPLSVDTVLQKFNIDNMEDVVILTSNNINATLFARTAPEQDMTGELVNDALYTRDRMLEEHFDTTITWNITDDDYALIDIFKAETVAGDSTFSFMIGPVRWSAVPAFTQGLCLDLSSIDGPDLTNPWWSHNVMDNFVYDGHYYMLIGEFSPRNVLSGNMLMFNLAEHSNRGLPSLYDMVRTGNWTFDAFCSTIRDVYTDLDGNGKVNNKDFYGMYCDSTAGLSFYFGMGRNLISVQDGDFVSSVVDDQSVTIIETLQSLFASADVNEKSYRSDTYAPNRAFMDNKALFNCMVVIDLSMFRDSDVDYGIVPLPKYDEQQSSYHSFANVSALTALLVSRAIPQDRMAQTGQFIEALTALSHFRSIPEAYDATLLSRETRDEESVEMLRIISEGLMLDIGAVYNIGGLYNMVESCTVDGKPVASTYQSLSGAVQADCENLKELFLNPAGN